MTTTPSATVEHVLAALELDRTGPDAFVAPCVRMGLPRVFGGQVLAQALIAATRTVESDIPAHSLHAYFLRPGDPEYPIEFVVGRVRDGRRLTCRTVTASQHGRPLVTMTTSFAAPLEGVRHQIAAPLVRAPEELPTLAESVEPWGGLRELWSGLDAVDVRVATVPPGPRASAPTDANSAVWLRMAGSLPDDPMLHQALLVYLSDVTALSAALVPLGVPIGIEEVDGRYWDAISLDHAVWFHHPVRVDEWLLFAQDSPSAGDGRALTRADVFTAGGRIAASLAQEGLFVPEDGGSR